MLSLDFLNDWIFTRQKSDEDYWLSQPDLGLNPKSTENKLQGLSNYLMSPRLQISLSLEKEKT